MALSRLYLQLANCMVGVVQCMAIYGHGKYWWVATFHILIIAALLVVINLCPFLSRFPVVPFCMHSPPGHAHKFRQLTHDPGLSDVAPTVLDLMGLDIPSEITGQSLL